MAHHKFKQLGLSFGEGVTLLGQFEQSGVDSSAALSSLSKATVAYAKDGKSLSQGLGELQDKVKNAGSVNRSYLMQQQKYSGLKAVLEWPMQFVEVL
ncbi:hypothetical protein LGVB_00450 [Lactobacillus gasseri]|nr:hypothetical protein [Lactobacillus gasseri]